MAKKPVSSRKPASSRKPTVQSLLKLIEHEELQEFIVSYAKTDKDFVSRFELYFADKDARIDIKKSFLDIVVKLILRFSDRGFVYHDNSRPLAKEMFKLLTICDQMVARKDFRGAFAQTTVILEQMIQVQTYTDDSSGRLGDVVSSAIEMLGELGRNDLIARDLKVEIFQYLLKEMARPIYVEYGDYMSEATENLRHLAVQLGMHEEFLAYVDRVLVTNPTSYGNYRREQFLVEKVEFLSSIGREAEADQLVQGNLNITRLRELEVERATAAGEYGKATKLLQDGLDKAQKGHYAGLADRWTAGLLKMAILMKNTPKVRQYAFKLAFNPYFEADHYRTWRETFPEADRSEAVNELVAEKLQEIEKENGKHLYYNSYNPAYSKLLILGQIYAEEGMWDVLLTLLRTDVHLESMDIYLPALKQHRPEELLEIYLAKIKAAAPNLSARSEYKYFAKQIKTLFKELPESKEQLLALAQRLILEYKRRPAMVEELTKILPS